MARDTSQQGLVSHTAVLNRLVQLGFEVLLPWADHLGYDLAYYVVEEYRSFGFFVHQESAPCAHPGQDRENNKGWNLRRV